MLAIRLQRRGRKGHAQYRVIVQDSRLSPKSEKVVASLGSYDPHTKKATLDKEKAEFYLQHGAQPSNRVIRILTAEKVKLPKWGSLDTSQQAKTKNPEKLRKDQPKEAAEEPTPEAESEAKPAEEEAKTEKTEEKPAEEVSDDKPEEKTEEKPDEAEDAKPEEDKSKAKEEKPAKE